MNRSFRTPTSWAAPPRLTALEGAMRRLRLASGLVLACFVTTHFLNHAAGLVSLEAMEAARRWFIIVWATLAGQVLLYGALGLHFLLALVALYRRRTLRMPAREMAQLVLGLALPFLLVAHVTGTRIELGLTGRISGYPQVLREMWALPAHGLVQAAALVVAWLHGCLGLWFWLRGKGWFRHYALLLFSVALLVPVLSLLGVAEAMRQAISLPPGTDLLHDARLPDIRALLYAGLALAVAVTLAMRAALQLARRRGRIRITYPDGRALALPPGFTVLEASRLGGVPHLSSCGGKGRCSTCRVRVTAGLETLPPPAPAERATLNRIHAAPDIRLACQLRPLADLAVAPVLSATTGWVPRIGQPTAGDRASHEREVAVLFCDLRAFTRLSERRLPYDTVFVLNRYFEVVGSAVQEAGGHLDKFIGDGALALFGIDTPPDVAARQALEAARRIAAGLAGMNALLQGELGEPLRIAMGLHAGPAIIGVMGYGAASSLTAVGDTINTASRLEGIAKERDAELVLSAHVAALAGLEGIGEELVTAIRGRQATLVSRVLVSAEELPPGA